MAFFRWVKAHPISVIVWITLIVGWEILGHITPDSQLSTSPLVPPWEYVFGDAFKSIANNWPYDFWAPKPSTGGEVTYWGAILALGYHTLNTLFRLILGLSVGVFLGVGTGLAVAYFPWLRRVAWTPLNFLRMLPPPSGHSHTAFALSRLEKDGRSQGALVKGNPQDAIPEAAKTAETTKRIIT